jgi:hypothetical protein
LTPWNDSPLQGSASALVTYVFLILNDLFNGYERLKNLLQTLAGPINEIQAVQSSLLMVELITGRRAGAGSALPAEIGFISGCTQKL